MARLTVAGAAKKVSAGAAKPAPAEAEKQSVASEASASATVEHVAAEKQSMVEDIKAVAEEALKRHDAAVAVHAAVPVHVSIDALVDALTAGDNRAETAGLRVVGPRKGRRRAGRAFGPEAVIIPLINLGEDELRSIDGDPELAWSVVPIDAEDDEA